MDISILLILTSAVVLLMLLGLLSLILWRKGWWPFTGIGLILLSAGLAAYIIIQAQAGAYDRMGVQVYVDLFGIPRDCYSYVLESQDRVLPRIDYAIWIHFTTCPEEIQRISRQKKFTQTKVVAHQWAERYASPKGNWFKPQSLGDTVIIYSWSKPSTNSSRKIYTNTAQTEAYCIDILY